MDLNKMREQVAQAFVDSLKEDKLPWHAMWRTSRPENAITGKRYRGINAFWLSVIALDKGYEDPRWCTFKQASDKGWHVKKGEKSSYVEFWCLWDKKERKVVDRADAAKIIALDPSREEDFLLRSRTYCVFNAAQIEGIPELTIQTPADIASVRAQRDVLLKNMALNFEEKGSSAFYRPSTDTVTLPPEGTFKSTYGYMATLLHECGHATGHESRLNRDLTGGFGSESYAKEELRAEITSAFTAQALSFGQDPNEAIASMDNHKAYIQSWISEIQDKPNELFAAIRDAEIISDYLLEKGEFLKDLERDVKNETPPLADRIMDATTRRARQKSSHKPRSKTPALARC